MRTVRIIPTLLIDGRGRLVKTVRFGKRTYIGDPINAVRIFNTKEVDELVLLDIDATRQGREPNYSFVEDIVSEAFMPIAYGGGIRSMEQIERLYGCGIEKVVLSSAVSEGTDLVQRAAMRYGSQAVVVCLQVERRLLGGYRLRAGTAPGAGSPSPVETARRVVEAGAGELLVYSVDRDGTSAGYDLPMLRAIADAVDVPVVACGGARQLDDFRAAVVEGGCSAAAAGSLFVYQASSNGVLISYPTQNELCSKVFERLS
ncbi:AglZ/HisF2 family acetamidino modification protein [Caulobacter sp. NIBR1757]|uniref:AglZ/HisF2 family acetamidino modification protein n=1 Tax=Caulobacter sp. NIBR1757 TaxID=3016000 RepID=UPI0022F0F7AB|nr:AglZ/HisF2 family acetamidino modification protein [Caulobacter sp. NIBR1757]WGM40043.1 Imidazole glycerol phosphate synthase subunit HisF [Caulobacter sp. NIBR1757]